MPARKDARVPLPKIGSWLPFEYAVLPGVRSDARLSDRAASPGTQSGAAILPAERARLAKTDICHKLGVPAAVLGLPLPRASRSLGGRAPGVRALWPTQKR